MPARKPTMSQADRNALRTVLTEATWLQGARARNSRGKVIDPRSPNACQWCLYGVAMRVGGRRMVKVLAARIRAQDPDGRWQEPDDAFLIFAWNDDPGRSFADVKALIA